VANVETWYFRNSLRLALAFTALAVIVGVATKPTAGGVISLVAMRFWLNAAYRWSELRRGIKRQPKT